MPRVRDRRRRQDPVGGRELRVRRAPREEVQQPQPVVRNVRRRPPADADEEAPLERRRQVDEPQFVAMHPDVDIQVNEPQLAALGEVNEVFDEPLMLPGFNEVDIFISQKLKDKIWNFEYTDLSLMHRNNFNCQTNNENTIGINDGMLVIQNKVKKTHTNISVEDWTDSFIAYAQVLIERYPGKASELFSYMSIIRGAAADHPVEKWYSYDQQFRLRVSRDHTKKWSSIDGFLWLRILTINTQKQQQANVVYKCYDFNFKGFCNKRNCQYRHACLKCGFNHPALRCRRFMDNEVNTGPSRFKRNNIAPLLNNSANRQNPKGSFNKR
ncbi:unnamed protein product [Mytilus coruscus]|uniref:C3H1-type domain-containing protein n=1 Tax=Mytilus coruscus TaxID=42192 RepID=A0A6J8DFB0_MYTCO|nr:unnamed protein product [Mytilus coruscus]